MQTGLFEQRNPYQWFTPEWAAVEIVERYFGDLTSDDLVCEPSCGTGAFLKAIPDHVPAYGVEIDPALVELAKRNVDRPIIGGDFTTVPLRSNTTHIVGNPPFSVSTVNAFVGRSHSVLPSGGKLGLLLPAYLVQTHRRVASWSRDWSLRVELIPRRLFPRLRLPLIFVLFTKDKRRDMIGLALYAQACDIDNMSKAAREVLQNGRPGKGVWRSLVDDVMSVLKTATLPEIYNAIEPRRPTQNQWWREKVRQQLQMHYSSTERGIWTKGEA